MSGVRFARIPPRVAGMRHLRGEDLRVLIAIASFADAEGKAFPGMGTIAALSGIDRRAVPRSLRRLENAGIIRRGRGKGGTCGSVYTIIFAGQSVVTCDDRGVITSDDRVSSPVMSGVVARDVRGVITSDALTDHGTDQRTDHGTDTPRREDISKPAPKQKTGPKKCVKAKIQIPEDWEPGEVGRTYATKTAGWSPERIGIEIAKFIAHHRHKGKAFSDIPGAWRKWASNGAGYDLRDRERGANAGTARHANAEAEETAFYRGLL